MVLTSRHRSRDRSPLSSERFAVSGEELVARAESPGSLGGFGLLGSRQLWVEGGACPCGGGQLHSPAHTLVAGPHQVVPQPVGALCAAGCDWGFFILAVGVTGARALPDPAAPVTSSAPLACMSGSVPASGVVSSASAASATGLSGRHECAWESPRSECRRQGSLSVGGPVRVRSVAGVGPLSFARSSRSAHASASSSAASSDNGDQEAAMPPSPAGHPGVGGSRSGGDRSAAGCDRSPQPGPSGLGSGFGGCSSPAPSVAADDDRASASDSVDLDRGDSFRAVLHLIREFHSMEEPASVAPNRCKTSLAPVYGLQSESS